MAGLVHMFVALGSLMALGTAAPSPPKYVELYTEQVVDHFGYQLKDTFMQRYFLSGRRTASKRVTTSMHT